MIKQQPKTLTKCVCEYKCDDYFECKSIINPIWAWIKFWYKHKLCAREEASS